MKIVYIIDWLDNSGGKERVISTKANYLAETNDVYIVCIKGEEHFFPLSEKINLIGLNLDFKRLYSFNFVKKQFKAHFLKKQLKRKLNEILHKIKADIVISTYSSEMSIVPSIEDGSRKILENHFCKGVKLTDARFSRKNFIVNFLLAFKEWHECKFKIPIYDRFVVLSEQDKSEWKKCGVNATCIYNPLPFVSEQTADLNSKIAISVGRLETPKNYSCLIEIWAIIHEKFSDWKLNIFGEGNQKNMLKDQIEKLNLQGIVNILPPERNIITRYLESSLYLATSCYEGFLLTLAEAFECGLPVVSFDIKCGPNEIVQNGENGFLIEFDNKKDFAEKAMSLMENRDLRNRFGKSAKQRAKKFRIENIMPQWEKLLKGEI